MKKALVVLLALAVVASGFAQPVADVNVAEFSGSAKVTWGVDLDAESTGFKNETEAKVVVNIFDAAEQSTEGDGIWAELVIKTDALKIVNEGKEGKFDTGDDGIRIDTAKLHLGPVYLGIMADHTHYGEFNAPEAVRQQHKVDNVGADRTQGIVLGFNHDLFNIAFDLRNPGQYRDDYALRGKLGITAVENLDLNVGFSMAFEDTKADIISKKDEPEKYIEVDAFDEEGNPVTLFYVDGEFFTVDDYMEIIEAEKAKKGFGANVAYKLAIGDEFYLKPGVGYTNKLADDDKGLLAFGVLFGFDKGDTGDDEIGLPYFDDKKKDKGTSGVSVSTELNLNPDPMVIPLAVGFYSGEIVENLTAAALFTTKNVEKVSDNYKFKAALKYAAAVGDGTITPRAGFRFAHVDVMGTDVDSMEVTLGAEFAGFVDNTTFDAVWESRNLSADPAGKGTFNASIKIAL